MSLSQHGKHIKKINAIKKPKGPQILCVTTFFNTHSKPKPATSRLTTTTKNAAAATTKQQQRKKEMLQRYELLKSFLCLKSASSKRRY